MLTQKDLNKLLDIVREKCQPAVGVWTTWQNSAGSSSIQEIWQSALYQETLIEQAKERIRQSTAPGAVNNLAGKYLGEVRTGMISKDPSVIAAELDRILRNPTRTPVDNAFMQMYERDLGVRGEMVRREVGKFNPKTQMCE